MEKLTIFRIFLYFPLVGFVLPDAGVWLSRDHAYIPFAHLIIEAILAASIALCSARISKLKKRESHATGADKISAYKA